MTETPKTVDELDEMRLSAITKVAGCERPDRCPVKICRCRGEVRAIRKVDDAAGLKIVPAEATDDMAEAAEMHGYDFTSRSKINAAIAAGAIGGGE